MRLKPGRSTPEDAWNTRGPERVAAAYTVDSGLRYDLTVQQISDQELILLDADSDEPAIMKRLPPWPGP